MGLTAHLIDMMEGYSKALYSSFFLFRNWDLLLDCGEGCASHLDRHQFRAQWVCVSHYHHDHSGGLKGLFLARAYTKGSNDRQLTVIYPAGSPSMERWRRWLEKDLPRLPFPLEWKPVAPGFRLRLSPEGARVPVDLEAFEAEHYARETCLGFRVVETRRRLKSTYASLPPREVARLARTVGQAALTEDYRKAILVYSGDSAPLPLEVVQEADLLVHDATFLSERDREEPGHASVEQVLSLATQAGVHGVVLAHVSGRYSLKSIRKVVPRLIQKTGYQGMVWVQWLEETIRLDEAVPQALEERAPAPPTSAPQSPEAAAQEGPAASAPGDVPHGSRTT